ncbi:hypothetical protein [Leucobacter japonicus]|uniref:hypothetical protein n=1 Tax=Leucobacter japonicus TaxID=1461259 RepID=UPI0006A788A0|nr:hypothetical protein [Leucobacter japonicus]
MTKRPLLTIRATVLLATSVTLVGSLVGCAPEPTSGNGSSDPTTTSASSSATSDTDASDDSASQSSGGSSDDANAHATADSTAKGGDASGSWEEIGVPGGGDGKSAELPASFPKTQFVVPAGATVDDAGERSASAWFVVLRAPNRTGADALWQGVITQSGFTVSTSEETGDDGISAHLDGAGLSVDALLIPNADGAVLLSYELALVG